MATRSTMRDAVLASLGMPNDGALNPSLVSVVERALDAAQIQLAARFPWVALRSRAIITWPAGTYVQDLPDAVPVDQVDAVTWQDANGMNASLDPGVTAEEEGAWYGIPMSYAMTPKQRDTGTESDTGDNVIILSPGPSEAGTVLVDYHRRVSQLDDDADVPLLNSELLVLHAAAHTAPAINPVMANALASQYAELRDTLARKQSSGQGWSLSRRGR